MGKPIYKMTREELQEAGRKGGKASGVSKRKAIERRKDMKGTFETLLNMSLNSGRVQTIEEIRAFAQIKGKNIKVNEALAVRVVQKALQGDLRAFELIRDSIGEKPIDKLQFEDITPIVITGEDDISE